MKFVDTHTHLYVEQFDEDRKQTVEKAISLGIEKFYLPGIDRHYYSSMLALEKDFPQHIELMIGLHPTHVNDSYEQELDFIKERLEERPFIAIGEIGIDLYWEQDKLDLQKKAFQEQIQLAKQYDLPIAIHCRDAFDEVFEILELEKGPKLKGVFHCFTGSLEQAQKALSYNLHLGIGGVVTFKNGKIDKFINEIPLEKILLETDSPYLAPTPFRGKRNESSYLTLVAEKLAKCYDLPLEKIAEQTTKNAVTLFEKS